MKKILIFITAIVLLTTSCNDWLHIEPVGEKEADDFFSTERGYKDALIGLYIKLNAENLYGKQLTFGNLEVIIGHWDAINDTYIDLQNFMYTSDRVYGWTNDVFLKLYNIIAEANKILEVIDEHQNVFEDPRMYKLIKGEALGIRAFCHLDLMRLWGPSPVAITGDMAEMRFLPYVTEITTNWHRYTTFSEYMLNIIADLSQAEDLLADVDPFVTLASQRNSLAAIYGGNLEGYRNDPDNFWNRRPIRMNYFAVCALKARAFIWMDDKEGALEYAQKVIEEGKHYYQLTSSEALTRRTDVIEFTEHIFALQSHRMDDEHIHNLFNHENGLSTSIKNYVEAIVYAPGDSRRAAWWQVDSETGRDMFYKYNRKGVTEGYQKEKIPLIRLSEMYLIAIECDASNKEDLYNQFVNARQTERYNLRTEMKEMLQKEYNREFYGEGQAFFYFKRVGHRIWSLNMENEYILNQVYRFPYPDAEIFVGI